MVGLDYALAEAELDPAQPQLVCFLFVKISSNLKCKLKGVFMQTLLRPKIKYKDNFIAIAIYINILLGNIWLIEMKKFRPPLKKAFRSTYESYNILDTDIGWGSWWEIFVSCIKQEKIDKIFSHHRRISCIL